MDEERLECQQGNPGVRQKLSITPTSSRSPFILQPPRAEMMPQSSRKPPKKMHTNELGRAEHHQLVVNPQPPEQEGDLQRFHRPSRGSCEQQNVTGAEFSPGKVKV